MADKGCTSDRPGVIRGCADVRASDTRYHARPFLKGSPFRDRRAPVAKAAPTPHAAGATAAAAGTPAAALDPLRSEEHTSELQSPMYLVCRLLLEKKNQTSGISIRPR